MYILITKELQPQTVAPHMFLEGRKTRWGIEMVTVTQLDHEFLLLLSIRLQCTVKLIWRGTILFFTVKFNSDGAHQCWNLTEQCSKLVVHWAETIERIYHLPHCPSTLPLWHWFGKLSEAKICAGFSADKLSQCFHGHSKKKTNPLACSVDREMCTGNNPCFLSSTWNSPRALLPSPASSSRRERNVRGNLENP